MIDLDPSDVSRLVWLGRYGLAGEETTERIRRAIRGDVAKAVASAMLSPGQETDPAILTLARVFRPETRCRQCGHLWGAYEDNCHCGGEECHNKDACEGRGQ